jgi:glycosyltransferase involved in cell wall biosynthesis
MKIALYYPWIHLTSGAERLLLELAGRSRHEWTLFTSKFMPASTFPGFAQCDVRQLTPVSVDRRLGPTAKSALTIAREKLPLDRYDALVVVCEGLGDFIVFRNGGIPTMNICLTPLRIVYDPVYRARYTAQRGAVQRALLGAASAVFGLIDKAAWKRYDRVLFISEEARRRAVAGGLGRAENQDVVHVGIGFEPSAPSERSDPYFLLPGRIMWTKNIELGIAAFQRFLAENPAASHFRLVIAGIVDHKSGEYIDKLRGLAGNDARIEFCVHPSDAELEALYRNAYGVLFTAFNEDWGIVPIEGMAFGKPVIAVDSGGPRESVQNGVQGYLEPADPSRFADRMGDLVRDPELARRMGRAGHERAKKYSWTAYVQRIDRELEQMAMQGSTEPSTPEVAVRRGNEAVSVSRRFTA